MPAGGRDDDALLHALTTSMVAVANDATPEEALGALTRAATDLVGARYGALGVPDADGDRFAAFLTVGMSAELVDRLGDLPRRHGILASLLTDPTPMRLDDVHDHPDFAGRWPDEHPDMVSFLGVPILHGDDVLGAFYLTDRRAPGASPDDETSVPFTEHDLRTLQLFAAHAAVVLLHARATEAQRELHTTAERERVAHDLHDALSQTLFSLTYVAEAAAARLGDGDPETARSMLDDVRALAASARQELGTVIDNLRPARLEEDGLAATLRFRADVVARAHGVTVDADVRDVALPLTGRPGDDVERQLLRIAEEALGNAVRHAAPTIVTVRLSSPASDVVELAVEDDGRGFDPDDAATAARRLGLTTMRARARAIGATCTIRSTPHGVDGTSVVVRWRRPTTAEGSVVSRVTQPVSDLAPSTDETPSTQETSVTDEQGAT